MIIFNTKEAAEYVGLSKPTLERFRCYGGGPLYCKIGLRVVRYRKADLDAWLEARLISSTSQRPA